MNVDYRARAKQDLNELSNSVEEEIRSEIEAISHNPIRYAQAFRKAWCYDIDCSENVYSVFFTCDCGRMNIHAVLEEEEAKSR